jgi:hypothetical protein
MQNKQFLVGILGLSLALGVLAGCKGSGGVEEELGKFEGSWRNTSDKSDIEYVFKGDEYVCHIHHRGFYYDGTFSYTDDEITFYRTQDKTTWTQKYTIDGDILFLERDKEVNSHFYGEFIKQNK